MAIVRTGVAWSSLVCWLFNLIGAASSEVGARSAPVGWKREARTCKVTHEVGAIVPTRHSGSAGVSQLTFIAQQRGQGAGQADQCAGSGASRGDGFGAVGRARVIHAYPFGSPRL